MVALPLCCSFFLRDSGKSQKLVGVLLVSYSFDSFSFRQQYFFGSSCTLQLSCLWRVVLLCVLFAPKRKTSLSLPIIEKREAYMLPNHSILPGIEKEQILEGTRVLPALERVFLSQITFSWRLPSDSGRPHWEDSVICGFTIPHWSGSELFLPSSHHLRGWLLRVLRVRTTAWWAFRERIDEAICGGALRGGIFFVRESAEAPGTAVHEEGSHYGSYLAL